MQAPSNTDVLYYWIVPPSVFKDLKIQPYKEKNVVTKKAPKRAIKQLALKVLP
jgi:hypothetical protein